MIPPAEWKPRKSGYDDIDLMIPAPLTQTVTGGRGIYQQDNTKKKPLHVKQFEKLAKSEK